MNNKAEQFNAFLEDQKIKVFQMEAAGFERRKCCGSSEDG